VETQLRLLIKTLMIHGLILIAVSWKLH